MSIQTDIDTLEMLPLLGPSRAEARAMIAKLALRIDPDLHPELALRVLIRRFLSAPVTPESSAQLSEAEHWAKSENLTLPGLEIQLIWCAAVGRSHPDAVDQHILQQAVSQAEKLNVFAVERSLALAACDAEHADTHLCLAISLMDHQKWAARLKFAWVDLADAKSRGADPSGAFEALHHARELAQHHQDPASLILTHTRIGLLHLEAGQIAKATPHIETAMAVAKAEEDDLTIVLTSTLLCAIYLNRDERQKTGETADGLMIAGARRANWFAVVDGHITRSTLLLLDGDQVGAIQRLVRAAIHLRELVPAAAINLLKGRLAELRYTLGPSVFDRHYAAAMAAQKLS